MGVIGALKSLDAYPKLQEEFRVRTTSGALMSIISMAFMLVLFFSELSYYLSPSVIDHLYVDKTTSGKLPIYFNITFSNMACTLMSIDVMDVTGEQAFDLEQNIVKIPLDMMGNPIGGVLNAKVGEKSQSKQFNSTAKFGEAGYCGSCYGAEEFPTQCCNTCQEVEKAYTKKTWKFLAPDTVEQCASSGDLARLNHKREGCMLYGSLTVNRVAGNFHIAPGHGLQHTHSHIHDLSAVTAKDYSMNHVITSLSFGKPFPGIVNPLDGQEREDRDGGGIHQYYVKAVPTSYQFSNGTLLETNQFSYTEHVTNIRIQQGHGLPGIFVFYDISPIKVKFEEKDKSFLHFVTQVCAIIGGVFTVTGLLDRALYHTMSSYEKKKIGKFN